jgi:phosphoserine phosphatase RsbU/P
MTSTQRTLLVIDNDESVRQSIVASLENSGFSVHLETHSQAGLQWFLQHRPDLVLVDLKMPDIDGIGLLQQIRLIDEHAPVLVTSAIGSARDVVEALRKGATDYLIKPVENPEFLAHAVNRAISGQDLKRENALYRVELEKANRDLKDYVRLLECDQQAARQVQRNLLPPTPSELLNVHLEHRVIPSLYLSGDFVDYGALQNRYLACYLTDVSGHGASSAFVTIWLKQLVRRVFRECRDSAVQTSFLRDPAQLVNLVNRELLQSHFGCHLTCFVGVVDLQERVLRYVLAGHLPLPILIQEGEARYLEGKGKPVGIFKDNEWQVYEQPLAESYSLVVFSDGVLEMLPPAPLMEREAYLLRQMADCQGSMTQLLDKLNLQSTVSAPDDIAILTLNQRGQV